MRDLEVLTRLERRRLTKQFAMTLVNRNHVDIYWLAASKRIVARAVASCRKLPIPAGAVFVGTYAHPFNVNDFLGDLNDVIAKLAIQAAAQPAACA